MFTPDTKILVADDMLTMRKIIVKHLKDLKYVNIEEAGDGQRAWEALEAAHKAAKPFQLILSDWNMPHMSGLDCLKKVRADDRFKTLPFLLITAEAEKTQIVEAVKSGVTHYIVKPFTLEVLQKRLTEAFSIWKQRTGQAAPAAPAAPAAGQAK